MVRPAPWYERQKMEDEMRKNSKLTRIIENRYGSFPVDDEYDNSLGEDEISIVSWHGDFCRAEDGSLYKIIGDGSVKFLR